ncbi:fatty-acyl-CoA synthase/long-chain acyl-CoA synthetase [Saccharopolyspora lacisalsi]|uniref:Fatty-acyl-CoA synthase/long-chain acyl-CoA synthetase n=1 Tax=Halosaccharopolyspora lacisalsi TaxID=1000566 RepID=A0A839DU05_9PSEU|nr:long-chain-fatty-acid--CoA ligase [Halosaccharopolyspora lacisalsi]MBA8824974.1 fatty-acyl-CoA synthase/long-chain acyl-CoA synthetase [Halosaccharopolyspora lacisalsi]
MHSTHTTSGMTISDQVARHARTIPDDVALRFRGDGRTYRELDERVTRLANSLRQRGAGPGDRIAVLGLDGPEIVESYLACTRLGAICVPINFRLVTDEIAYVLSDSGAVAAVVDTATAEAMTEAREQLPAVENCLVIGASSDRSDTEHSYEQALRQASSEPVDLFVDEHSPAFIMYTSGTTGRPKGAVLTHHNLLIHAFSSMAHLGTSEDDKVWLAAVPLFHIAGLSGMLPSLLRGGSTVILPSGRFDPTEVVDLLEHERVSSVFLVPAQWQAVCDVPGIARRDLSALHRISWGAAPAPTTLLRTMIETFPHAEVVTSFGQTECSPITTTLRGRDALRKLGSVGTPMLNVEARVVDEDMNDVPRGQVGEIVYRGPTVMKEYWGKPRETAEVFRGGWFHSGDLVRQDEEGYCYLVDRKKDMIISGGENIYCAEVEDVLAAHPKVSEVALIGVADPKWGEIPLAVVVPRETTDPPTAHDIDGWCRKRLARYKTPREMATVTALPRNPSGKVLKTELRSEYAAGSTTSHRVE